MKLYRIEFDHCGPKDREAGIKTYVIANDEVSVYEYIDRTYKYSVWSEDDETYTHYDDNYIEIGKETKRERVLRLRGDIHDDDIDFSDAYYGITLWGWSRVGELSVADAEVLTHLGIAADIRA